MDDIPATETFSDVSGSIDEWLSYDTVLLTIEREGEVFYVEVETN